MAADWRNELKIESDAGKLTLEDENGIVRYKIASDESYLFHKEHTKGAHLRKLADVRFHQVQWETPYYIKIFDSFLGAGDLKGKTILDFGCGDGRFTKYLLDRGADRIVCIDFDYATLVSLARFVEERGSKDKVLIIHGDYDNLPFKDEQFSLILSIGVLYYLNERYEEALKKFRSLLFVDGDLITSDPELEGFFFRSLFLDGLEEALEIAEQKRFKETREKTGYAFRVFDKHEWKKIFADAELKVLGHQGVSMFHNIIRVLQLRGLITEASLEANQERLWRILDYFHETGSLFKHSVWHLRK